MIEKIERTSILDEMGGGDLTARPEMIRVRDICSNFIDNAEDGCTTNDGKINIRPSYQRNFIYGPKKRNAVVLSVLRGLPIGLIHWASATEDEHGAQYEVLDGQQRMISILAFVKGDYEIKSDKGSIFSFNGLVREEQEKILDYQFPVSIFNGCQKDKLDWFRIINMQGTVMTEQELRSSVYHGTWLKDAKVYFASKNCKAMKYEKYLGSSRNLENSPMLRQAWLGKVIDWAADSKGMTPEEYMSKHQNDENAESLWHYFSKVMNWMLELYPEVDNKPRHMYMSDVDWGYIYNKYSKVKLPDKFTYITPNGNNDVVNEESLDEHIRRLMGMDVVDKKRGVFTYIFSNDERDLALRGFDGTTKATAYNRQKGMCAMCGNHFEYEDMVGDHIRPWSRGGLTVLENCQMLCKRCNGAKTDCYPTEPKKSILNTMLMDF